MTTRITNKDLQILLDRINKAHGFERAYGIGRAYGGVRLEQYVIGGGVRTVSWCGYGTKRQLYNFMLGVLEGLTYKVGNDY